MRIESCRLCPRECGVLREAESGAGFCGMGADPVVARAALHYWEEPCISGTKGSGAIFFTGCSLQCVFCQNYEISTERSVGKRITPQELAGIFRRLEKEGAETINLVNPTHFVAAVRESLLLYKPSVPVVYNSGGYDRPETLRTLEGLIDVYLPDWKYASRELGELYSGAANYCTVVKEAVAEMVRQTGPAIFNDKGILLKGTLVRHLILPGNTRNSIQVLEEIAALSGDLLVSLMAQYVPCGRAEQYPEINRRITAREYDKVQQRLFELGLEGFVQERGSAKKDYIPPFNLEGVSI